MNEPRLVPFEPWHLETFVNRETGRSDDPQTAPAHYGFTAVLDNKVLGCGGMLPTFIPYVGVPWLSLSSEIERHKLWITRVAKHELRGALSKLSLARAEMTVPIEKERNRAWALALGFREAGLHAHYILEK